MILLDLPPLDVPKPAIIRPAPDELLRYGGDPVARALRAHDRRRAAGSGVPIIGTFINRYANTGSATTYNFASSDFGSAFTGRRLLVGVVGTFSSRSIAAVTIGGASAIIPVQQQSTAGSSENCAGFALAQLDAGTSGTVSVQWSGSQNGCAIAVWSISGLNVTDTLDEKSDPLNGALSLTTSANGFAAAIQMNENSRSVVWNGSLVEHYDESWRTSNHWSGASQQTTGTSLSVAPTLSGSASKSPVCAVSFG